MDSNLLAFPFLLFGYSLGSVSFGLVFAKVFKLGDIRKIGSGNTGATNVLRTKNKKAAALTLFLDVLKGWLPVFLFIKAYAASNNFVGETELAVSDQATFGVLIDFALANTGWTYGNMFVEQAGVAVAIGALAVAFAPIVGHVFPVWHGFKGGKGVATMFGVYLACSPLICLILFASWGAIFAYTRISSLSALVSFCVIAPLVGITHVVMKNSWHGFCFEILCSLLILFTHRHNIKRLLAHTEKQL
ncbi:MAG: glycerol-3-phosphate 1-O-acyltransferase PlsY [Holosporales bacterium]|nr:glycerol-3-phosphate 1-O-acyltransferase PlsY [Holosporales bacterium]